MSAVNDNRLPAGLARILLLCLLCLLPAFTAQAEAPLVHLHDLRDSYSLAGQWRFSPGDEPQWASPEFDDSAWQLQQMPGRWPAGGYPETGQMGWYRLTLQLHAENELPSREVASLGLRMGEVMNAYEVFAGGKLIGSVGKMPPLGEIDYDRQQVVLVPDEAIGEGGRLVLAIRVWGGPEYLAQYWTAGPYGGQFLLGDYKRLLLIGLGAETPAMVLCILSLTFGLYHLYLYRRNRVLNSFYWFGVMAVTVGIYGLMLNQWKYMFGVDFLLLKKIEYCALYLLPPIGLQMLVTMLEMPLNKWLRAYQYSFVLPVLLVLVMPGHEVHAATLTFWQLWCLPMLIVGPMLVVLRLREGHTLARNMVVALVIFALACLNDLIIDLMDVDSVRLVPLGFAAVVLAMGLLLGRRFSGLVDGLEQEVAERTVELSEANQQLAEVARMDPLTGLLNRRGFLDEAEAEIQRFLRNGRGFSIVLADVDHFKTFNDQHGHAGGDHVLKRLGSLLRRQLRDVDRVARWGGEEFIMLLPETGRDGAVVLAEKLRERIADNLFEYEGDRLGITMTFGIATHRKGEGLEACIARADTALYHGKERGRNRVMIGDYKGLTLVS
jgi:diguanylate cyclase (GGDEF)-like protein